MCALAGMLKERGFQVSGSDANVYPPMSDLLAEMGIPVRSPYGPANLPDPVDLVVVGNAISRGNPELEQALDLDLALVSMPQLLKELFLRGRTVVVVAGTHGKTTTTSLLAWLLHRAGRDPGFLVGGLPLDFGRSFRLGSGAPFVIEGDEYDTAYFDKGPKFLHYLPRVAVIGNVEFDHADIYPDLNAVKTSFSRLANLVPRRGLLAVGSGSEAALASVREAPCRLVTFGLEAGATWQARAVRSCPEGSRFEVYREGSWWGEFEGPLWGEASVRNALAALVVGEHLGLGPAELAAGLGCFSGVRRRLEVRGEARGVMVVDDFAHHPTAIRETLAAARQRWPGRRIWAVFEPRSYTARTRIFQRELADALAHADAVIVSRVFRTERLSHAEELAEEEVTQELVGRGRAAYFVPEVDDIVSLLKRESNPSDLVLAMSNGAFGGLPGKLLAAFAG
jgi:UDP-N-acetylmuramate: L-alanyl-gamma-D-glutamyl-meso-diaminopimelate ligase